MTLSLLVFFSYLGPKLIIWPILLAYAIGNEDTGLKQQFQIRCSIVDSPVSSPANVGDASLKSVPGSREKILLGIHDS